MVQAPLATERLALRPFTLDDVDAIVALQNARSLRIVAKLGFVAEKDLTYAGLPHRLFALERPRG